MKFYKVNGFARIAKKNAERRYKNGETIYLCACNLKPGVPWHPELAISKYGFIDESCGEPEFFMGTDDDFNRVVNEFSYFNCNNRSGKYPAYYIREGKQ